MNKYLYKLKLNCYNDNDVDYFNLLNIYYCH